MSIPSRKLAVLFILLLGLTLLVIVFTVITHLYPIWLIGHPLELQFVNPSH